MNLRGLNKSLKLAASYLILGGGTLYGQGVLLTAGQDYFIDIPSLHYVGINPFPPLPNYDTRVTLNFSNNLLDPTDLFTLTFYETWDPVHSVSVFNLTHGLGDSASALTFEVLVRLCQIRSDPLLRNSL